MTRRKNYEPSRLLMILVLFLIAISIVMSDISGLPFSARIILFMALLLAGVGFAMHLLNEMTKRDEEDLRRMMDESDRVFETIIRRLEQKDWWTVLEIPRESSLTDIKARYRTLIKQVHPNAAPDGKGDPARSQQLTEAYDAALREKGH